MQQQDKVHKTGSGFDSGPKTDIAATIEARKLIKMTSSNYDMAITFGMAVSPTGELWPWHGYGMKA